MAEVTQLIERARKGDVDAARALFESVYHDLHRLAARQVQRGSGGLGSTSLVHEAYLRLARPEALSVNDRGHFFAVAARAMRQIAVDHARERLTAKRGGGLADVTLGAAEGMHGEDAQRHDELLALNEALDALERADARLAKLVELRFFAGLNLEEAGEALGLSSTTLKRDFRRARAFLHARLGPGSAADALD